LTALAVTTICALSYLAGSLPFSQFVARIVRGADLRTVGSRTVSGTSLYRVAGFTPLAVAGVLDIGKGALGPVLADPAGHMDLAALAVGLAITGHNWSPFLGGAGGRGLSPAIGGLAVVAWPGSLLLLVGLAIGKLAQRTGLVTFVAIVVLTPLLVVIYGSTGALIGLAVTVPMVLKRLLGNQLPEDPSDRRIFMNRLLYDADDARSGQSP
jgi:glycerol-3-phosphate acyltransferase PlsY